MSKIELIKGRCIICPDDKDLELITENGIYTGKTRGVKIKKATVIMVHPDEDILETEMRILYSGTGAPITIDGKKCLNVSVEENIEGIIS